MKYVGLVKDHDQVVYTKKTKDGQGTEEVCRDCTPEVRAFIKENFKAGDFFDFKNCKFDRVNDSYVMSKAAKYVPPARENPRSEQKSSAPVNANSSATTGYDKNQSIVNQVIFKVAGDLSSSVAEVRANYKELKAIFSEELINNAGVLDVAASSHIVPDSRPAAPASVPTPQLDVQKIEECILE